MNRRKEDRLIKMAFGELEETQNSAPRNDKESEVLQGYAELRKGLTLARDIPQHQLSNERLRHAILGEGLHQNAVREEHSLGWLWNGLGLCGLVAICALSVARMRMVNLTPDVKMDSAKSLAAKEFQFEDKVELAKKPAETLALTNLASGYRLTEFSHAVARTTHHKHSHRHINVSQDPNVDPSWQALEFKGTGSEAGRLDDGNAGTKSGMQMVSLKTGDKRSSSEPLVEIEQDQDGDTGARAAREVASKNFVVGG